MGGGGGGGRAGGGAKAFKKFFVCKVHRFNPPTSKSCLHPEKLLVILTHLGYVETQPLILHSLGMLL